MILQLKNISKSFDGKELFKDINIKVESGEKIGLIGVNGAGKSTLFKIISGELESDFGEVALNKGTKIGYLKQESGLNLENTIKEEFMSVFDELLNIEKQIRALEIKMATDEVSRNPEKLESIMSEYSKKIDYFTLNGGYEIETKISYVVSGMGLRSIRDDIKIDNLSGGQKTKIALAKILLESPDILLLDEPTNHLDFEALKWLENHIKSYDGSVLVISHDRYFLDSMVNTIYEVERGICKRYVGNYSKYVETKSKNRLLYQREFEKQQKTINKLQTFVDKNIVRASTSKAAKSRRKALEKMDIMENPLGDLKRVNMRFETNKKSHFDVLNLKRVTVAVGEEDFRIPLIEDMNLNIKRGSRVAFIGPNGIGKSTLLKTIIGDNKLDNGLLNWGKRVELGYYDQEHAKLNESRTIYEEMREDFPKLTETKIRTVLGNFLFSKEDVFKNISDLSGGEKARVALSKLMLKKANVLILDEPTNHLDLYSKEVLEKALEKYDGTIIFVSHDRYFINKIANKIVRIDKTGIKNFDGNYDDYLIKEG